MLCSILNLPYKSGPGSCRLGSEFTRFPLAGGGPLNLTFFVNNQLHPTRDYSTAWSSILYTAAYEAKTSEALDLIHDGGWYTNYTRVTAA